MTTSSADNSHRSVPLRTMSRNSSTTTMMTTTSSSPSSRFTTPMPTQKPAQKPAPRPPPDSFATTTGSGCCPNCGFLLQLQGPLPPLAPVRPSTSTSASMSAGGANAAAPSSTSAPDAKALAIVTLSPLHDDDDNNNRNNHSSSSPDSSASANTFSSPSTTTSSDPSEPHTTPQHSPEQPSQWDTTTTSSSPDHDAAFAALAAAHRRIAELESQVRLLNQKAAAAVDRWADFEDEIARLRADARRQQDQHDEEDRRRKMQALQASPLTLSAVSGLAIASNNNHHAYGRPNTSCGAPTSGSATFAPPASPSLTPSRISFFSSLLSPRRSVATLRPDETPSSPPRAPPLQRPVPHTNASSSGLALPPRTPPPDQNPQNTTTIAAPGLRSPGLQPPPSSLSPPSTPAEAELLEALTREQNLRQAAEGRLSATSKEVEELSAALFEQANEMVADERRARARLLERVDVLEKRDLEKRKRLDRLEAALLSIRNARALLADGGAEDGQVAVVSGPGWDER